MTYIEELDSVGQTRRYAFQLGGDRVTAIVAKAGSCLKVGNTILDKELSDIVAEELTKSISELNDIKIVERANAILAALGYKTVSLPETARPVDEAPEKAFVRDDVKDAFRDWSGTPTSYQKQVLASYGLEFVKGKGHGKIRKTDDPGKSITVSSTPSSKNAGRNVAGDIIRYLLDPQ